MNEFIQKIIDSKMIFCSEHILIKYFKKTFTTEFVEEISDDENIKADNVSSKFESKNELSETKEFKTDF